jgi:3-hydroxyisobutyrate dehydrogenase-like beta-hydroxyacid dehydrogenase
MGNILSICLLLVLTVCSRVSASDRLVEVLKTTRAWTETVQMLGEAWQQKTVPDLYTEQTLTKSQQEIAKEVESLDSPLPLLQQLQQTIEEIKANVTRGDRTSLVTSLQKLSAQQKQLEALETLQEAQL